MKIFFSYLLSKRRAGLCFLVVILGVCTMGCLESKQELILNPDGSGRFIAQYVLGEELTRTIERSEALRETATGQATTERELPLNLEDLAKQFQGEGIEIENSHFEKKDGRLHISYSIAFDSIIELLETKVFRNVELTFYRDVNTNNLAFQMRIKNFLKKTGSSPEKLEGIKADVIVMLPGKVLETNADVSRRNRLTWNYTKDKLKPEVMTALCESAGLSFLTKLPVAPKKVATIGYVYDPTGKPDPFRPFIMELTRPKAIVKKPLHPLQRYDISQLKLVAIIWKVDNPRAILEDATGKGYIIAPGSYVGKNEGKVSKISDKEVVITEKSTNVLGETKIEEIRLSLHEEERGKK